jgi:hypothetical protein
LARSNNDLFKEQQLTAGIILCAQHRWSRMRGCGRLMLILGMVVLGQGALAALASAATIEWTGNGDGHSWTDGSNWNGGVPGPSDTAVVRRRPSGPSSVDVPAGITLRGLLLGEGGRLNGGSMRVDESFTMTGGDIGTALELAAAATGRISTTDPVRPPSVTAPGGSVVIRGSLTLAPSAQLVLAFDASIDNHGTLRLENGSTIQSGRCCVLPISTLRNFGTLVTGSGTATLAWTALVNSGQLRQETGTLVLTVAPSSLAAGSRLTGTGRVVLRERAELKLTTSLVVDSEVTLELQDGRLIGTSAAVSGGGIFAWMAGQVEGALTLAAGSRLLIDGTAKKSLAGPGSLFTNAGTGTVRGSGPIQLVGSSTFTNSGQLTQTSGTTWTFSTCCTAPATWQNTGSYKLIIPAGATALLEGMNVRNSGSVLLTSGRMSTRLLGYVQTAGSTRLAGGSLASPQGLIDIRGGTLAGLGTIVGAVRNAAVVDPRGLAAAAAPGTLNVQGSYTQTATGSLRLQLSGAGVGKFDRVLVSGAAKLAGTLRAVLVGGFLPAQGTFAVLVAGSRSGTFGTVQLPASSWRVSYTATGVTVRKPGP